MYFNGKTYEFLTVSWFNQWTRCLIKEAAFLTPASSQVITSHLDKLAMQLALNLHFAVVIDIDSIGIIVPVVVFLITSFDK